MSEFKVGDIVQFNLGEEYQLNGCYGQIDKINKTNIRVYIPKKYSWVYGYEYYQKKRFTDSFKPSQLKVVGCIEDFLEMRVSLLYNKSYHSLSTYKYKFSPNNDCSVEGCNCKAVKRILYNCWGIVSEFDVCEEHAKYDGYCGDGFPHKKDYHPVDMIEKNNSKQESNE